MNESVLPDSLKGNHALHLRPMPEWVLRYGENPHQQAVICTVDGQKTWWETAKFHSGKAMSYLNFYDSSAAWNLVHQLGGEPTAVVIKHANPCGVAIAYDDITAAYRKAHACDEVSAFGGIVAVNRPVTVEMAEALRPVFTEVVIAPGYEDGVFDVWAKKKDLRILEAVPPSPGVLSFRQLDAGAFLVQTVDPVAVNRDAWRVVTKAQPTDQQLLDAELAWRVVARTTSNAIVLVKDQQAVGIGCGQQNRRDAGRLACEKANGRAEGGVYASDAFFPFPDGLDGAIEAGAGCVIQPGGSVKDDEVIAYADEHGLAMIFTGERHFKH